MIVYLCCNFCLIGVLNCGSVVINNDNCLLGFVGRVFVFMK